MNNLENQNLFLQPREEVAVLPLENKSMLTSDKSDLTVMVSRVIEGATDGSQDPLDAFILAKKGAYVFNSIVEGLKDTVKLPQPKGYEMHNADLSERTTGVTYSYDRCNDPVWAKLSSEAQIINQKLKERETFLKELKSATDCDVVNEDTGEVETFTIYPAMKLTGTSIIVTLK